MCLRQLWKQLPPGAFKLKIIWTIDWSQDVRNRSWLSGATCSATDDPDLGVICVHPLWTEGLASLSGTVALLSNAGNHNLPSQCGAFRANLWLPCWTLFSIASKRGIRGNVLSRLLDQASARASCPRGLVLWDKEIHHCLTIPTPNHAYHLWTESPLSRGRLVAGEKVCCTVQLANE